MHVRRPWYTLFIGRFYWTWNDGFKPPNQKDSKLLLLTLQGVAGIAYRTQAAKWIDLRGYPPPKVRFADYRKFIAAGMAALLFLSLFWSTFKLPSLAQQRLSISHLEPSTGEFCDQCKAKRSNNNCKLTKATHRSQL
jgi:hypothetical protein